MRVYGDSISGNCLKVKYTADRLRIPYEWIELDISEGTTRTPEFLKMSPMGQVPVVTVDDGSHLAQSNAIIRYLAAGSDLLPDDRFAQAKIDELLFWEQYSHEPYIAVCRYQMVYLKKPKSELEPWRVARGEAALDLMEKLIDGRTWFCGDRFTIADIALFAYSQFAGDGGFDVASRKAVTAWLARCRSELALAQ